MPGRSFLDCPFPTDAQRAAESSPAGPWAKPCTAGAAGLSGRLGPRQHGHSATREAAMAKMYVSYAA